VAPEIDAIPWYSSILGCPDCHGPFERRGANTLWCPSCAIERNLHPNADFRPKKSRVVALELPARFDPELCLKEAELRRPELTYTGPVGQRDGSELLSVLQQTLPVSGNVLDLGCGPRDQAVPIMSLGHNYVGIDYSSNSADMLVDAHSLPFLAGSFDFVFSYAVLEHLHNPFLALREVGRVLKPGGTMCGTVSQGEPFHNSYFHHTVWGLLSVCMANRFEVVRLWACWDTLEGLADMGRYSKPVRFGLRLLSAVNSRMQFLTPRKMKWPMRDKALDELHRAASIGFVIRRMAD
jgi:SAM-dependent methyltransferase